MIHAENRTHTNERQNDISTVNNYQDMHNFCETHSIYHVTDVAQYYYGSPSKLQIVQFLPISNSISSSTSTRSSQISTGFP